MEKKIISMHEASGQDITFQHDLAYSLTSGGGGKPGQGYPCIVEIPVERYVPEILKDL